MIKLAKIVVIGGANATKEEATKVVEVAVTWVVIEVLTSVVVGRAIGIEGSTSSCYYYLW